MSGICKSKNVEVPAEKNSTKFLDTKKIPDVVWQQIFGYFSLKEIKLNVAKVSRHFYAISNDCVQEIKINYKIFGSEHKFDMLDALPTFKYLKSVIIEDDPQNNYRVRHHKLIYFIFRL